MVVKFTLKLAFTIVYIFFLSFLNVKFIDIQKSENEIELDLNAKHSSAIKQFNPIHIVPKFNHSSPIDQFTQCMLNLERNVLTQSQIDEWDLSMETIPYAVKIFDNKYWILGLALDDNRFNKLHYSCNVIQEPSCMEWNVHWENWS